MSTGMNINSNSPRFGALKVGPEFAKKLPEILINRKCIPVEQRAKVLESLGNLKREIYHDNFVNIHLDDIKGQGVVARLERDTYDTSLRKYDIAKDYLARSRETGEIEAIRVLDDNHDFVELTDIAEFAPVSHEFNEQTRQSNLNVLTEFLNNLLKKD